MTGVFNFKASDIYIIYILVYIIYIIHIIRLVWALFLFRSNGFLLVPEDYFTVNKEIVLVVLGLYYR